MSKSTFERAVSVAPRPAPETHTPGPLALHGKMVRDTLETVGGMFCIRPIKHTKSVTGRPIIDYSAPSIAYAYSAADAELFAAAPDMLAALRWAVGMAEEAILVREEGNDPEDTPEVIAMHREALEAARAALAKAEGRR